MTTARKWAGILLWVLGTAMAVTAAFPVQPDPSDLYETAGRQMQAGSFAASEAAAERLRELVVRHPEWDPGGVYLRELLPPLKARLKRLRGAEQKLEDFTTSARSEPRQPPPDSADPKSPTAARSWATSTIARLRAERDRLIAENLPSSEDRTLLARTEAYRQSEQLLAGEMLRLVEKAVSVEVAARAPRDPQLQTVQTRLDQIKKEMIGSVVERDRQKQAMEDLQTKSKLYQEVLFELLFDAPSETDSDADLSTLFAAQIDREIEEVHGQPSQSGEDYRARRSRLERYARFNRVLSSAGLIKDQAARIRALDNAVEESPHDKDSESSAASRGWLGWLLGGLLAGGAATFVCMAARRFSPPAQASPGRESQSRQPDAEEDEHAA